MEKEKTVVTGVVVEDEQTQTTEGGTKEETTQKTSPVTDQLSFNFSC